MVEYNVIIFFLALKGLTEVKSYLFIYYLLFSDSIESVIYDNGIVLHLTALFLINTCMLGKLVCGPNLTLVRPHKYSKIYIVNPTHST